MSLTPEVKGALFGVGRILSASIKLGLLDKMTVRQAAVLFAILRLRKEAVVEAMVADLGIPLGSTSRIIDSLVDLRLLEKSTNPDNARKLLVELTPQGEALMAAVAATNYRFRKGDAA